jgi:coenzyme Q-binding protein COQ10
MPEHSERRRVPHAPDDVFALVADVRDYPSFIKWVRGMRVIEERVVDGSGELTAEALVGYKVVRERFTTKVTLDRPGRAIDVAFVSGPFDALENRWRFKPLADGATEVEFFIRYEIANPILKAVLAAMFDRAAAKIMDAFMVRARERFPVVGDALSSRAEGEGPRGG